MSRRSTVFAVAESLLFIVSFLDVYCCCRLIKVVVRIFAEVGRQRNNRKIERIKFGSQPERMMVSSQDRVDGLNDAVWRR
jgi:hypothetical protein